MSSYKNSKDKMDVTVTNKMPWGNNKKWVRAELKRGRAFIPSFADIYRLIQAICFCEDDKYPNGKGRKMVEEFVRDCVWHADFQELERKYSIPRRCKQSDGGPRE
jgi:hypothetical protein